MKRLPPSRCVSWCVLAGLLVHCDAAVLNVTPGVNNLPIQQVTYTIGGNDVVQSTEAVGVTQTGDSEVYLKSVRITDGAVVDLPFFNTGGAKVVNLNPQLGSTAGAGVFNNGVTTNSNAGLANYAIALAGTSQDTDLRNYSFHDFLVPTPPVAGVSEFDLLFKNALNLSDYLLVAERWGNSFFEVTALMADGTPYASANTLRLGGPGGDFGVGYQVSDWNTGFAAAGSVPSQAQVLIIASVAKFFEGTNATPGPVYGLRVVNDGEADPKILGISNNTFSDNPENPLIVPEPSSFLMLLAAAGSLMGFRRRIC